MLGFFKDFTLSPIGGHEEDGVGDSYLGVFVAGGIDSSSGDGKSKLPLLDVGLLGGNGELTEKINWIYHPNWKRKQKDSNVTTKSPDYELLPPDQLP
ncbi:unnamed protein product [Acanthoscelides obtectus]|uniref:Uncharacterized protein n=1 Tax=Acanthoscelides obtectus TaxID=200917 RepID=A0A9P0KRI5_ACAOB|nr:unnamed protein product [Acanthoscelides obtectus]CAK1677346.1 hypothetical protein AOBTE_LOCUS31258 [Acanthoscelides obtectus]